MKRRMKKSLAFLLSFVLAFSCLFGFSAVAFAEDGEDDEEIVEVCDHESLTHVETKDATCTEDGISVDYYVCDSCGLYFADEECTVELDADTVASYVISATDHDYQVDEDKSSDPTCVDDGYTVYVCSGCGSEYAVTVPATGIHTLEYVEGTVSCTETGTIGCWECTVCGAQFTDEEGSIPLIDTGITNVPAGHNYVLDEDQSYAATCTEDGLEVYICSECEDEYDVEIPAEGHTLEAIEAVEATCIADGNEAYYKCSVCDACFSDEEGTVAVDEADTVIAAVDHAFFDEDGNPLDIVDEDGNVIGSTYVEGRAATCTEAGTVGGYWVCANCGLMFADNDGQPDQDTILIDNAMGNVIAATGHDYQITDSKNATCTEDGYITYTCQNEGCEDCCDEYTYTETIAATGHDYQSVDEVAATCTEDGVAAHYICTNVIGTDEETEEDIICGTLFTITYDEENDVNVYTEVTEEDLVIPATGHTYDNGVVTKEATCTEDGVMTYTCEAGDDSYTESIDATGHSYVGTIDYQEATDDADATYVVTYSCEKGDTEEATVAIASRIEAETDSYDAVANTVVIDVTDDEGNLIAAVKVTLPEDASVVYDEDSNKFIITIDDEEIDVSHVHDAAAVDALAATCTAEGNIAYWYCEGCNEYFDTEDLQNAISEADTVIAALNHTDPETDESYIIAVEPADPTCIANGVSETYYKCSACGACFSDEEGTETVDEADYIIPAVDHVFFDEDGNALDIVDEDGSVIGSTHVEGTDPTCTESGIVGYYKCYNCGMIFAEVKVTDEEGNLVYDEDDKVVTEPAEEPTMDFMGGIIPPTGHTLEEIDPADATCIADGVSETYYKCSVCGACFSDEEGTEAVDEADYIIPAVDHVFVDEDGNPLDIVDEDGNVIGSTYVEGRAASCTEAGTVGGYWVCANCGLKFADKDDDTPLLDATMGNVIAATEHNYQLTDTVEPTCDAVGYYVYVCTNDKVEDGVVVEDEICGDTIYEEIPAMGHIVQKMVIENDVAETCTTDGSYDTVIYCAKCGEEVSRVTTVIPATGHTYEFAAEESATCTEDGVAAHYECANDGCGLLFTLTYDEENDVNVYTEVTEADLVIEATGHSYVGTIDYQEATDDADATYVITYSCEKGDVAGTIVIGNQIDAEANSYDAEANTVVVDATDEDGNDISITVTIPEDAEVTDNGDGTYTIIIGDEDIEVPHAHEVVYVAAVAPTCIADGNIAYWYCADCNEYFADEDATIEITPGSIVIPATDHVFFDEDGNALDIVDEDGNVIGSTHVEGTPATCYENGTIGYFKCYNCGMIFAETEDEDGNIVPAEEPTMDFMGGIIPASHAYVLTETVEPTCTQFGYVLYVCQNGCGEDVYEVIPATGHDMVFVPATDPTCTEAGTVAHYYCNNCGLDFVAVPTDEVDEDGNTIYEATDTILIDSAILLNPATGHDMVYVEGTAATCTENGTIGYWHCNNCDLDFIDEDGTTLLIDSAIALDPATGHDYVVSSITYTFATDEADASYTITYTCSVCGDEGTYTGTIPAGSSIYEELSALGFIVNDDGTISGTVTLPDGTELNILGAITLIASSEEETPEEETPEEETPEEETPEEENSSEETPEEGEPEESAEEPTDESDEDADLDEDEEDLGEDEEAEDEEDVEDIEDVEAEEEVEEDTEVEEAAEVSSDSSTSPATGVAITGAVLFVLIIALAAMIIIRRRNKAEDEA